MNLLHNEADAEDVVQQTFLYLFYNFEKLGDVDSPSAKAYIAKTAEHRAIDILRGKKRFASLEDCPDFNSPHIDTLHPLEDALSQLAERYRELLVLQYIEGYLPCTIVALAALMWFFGQRDLRKLIPIAIILPIVIYFGFTELLKLKLP